MSKRKMSVYLNGKKVGDVKKVEFKESPLPRIYSGRMSIIKKTTHDIDGSPAEESHSSVDAVTHIEAKDKWELVSKLRSLADEIAMTSSDFDNGSTAIFIGRRYSHAALKRMRGQ